MRRLAFWPHSLHGQLALLIAIALFAAQAVSFGMLLRERRIVRFSEITLPAITRIVDAGERLQSSGTLPAPPPDAPGGGRGRVRLMPDSPVPAGLPHAPEVEEGIRGGLHDAGLPVGRVVTGVRPFTPGDPRFDRPGQRGAQRFARIGGELLIAVEQPGRGWLVLRTPWPRSDNYILWRLIAQTLILYGILLIPVLWIAGRIARPLRSLADAARGFDPAATDGALVETGPRDVRSVIAAFNALRLRVIAMLDEKDRMLGAIGHDLRTPLAALRVRIESVEDDGDRARMADIIAEMNHTLEDILSLARLGRPGEPPVEVDLAALVDAVVDDFRDLGAEVDYEEAPRVTLRLRAGLMRRAVRNLIENAVKYAGAAEVRLVPTPGAVTIEVADRGPGIPAAEHTRVFDAFTRIETSRNRDTGGIGLGLALTRAIVGDAGGQVRVANREGGGLLATISLPR